MKQFFKAIFKKWQQISQNTKSYAIFYKIIKIKHSTLTLQCINSNAIFHIKLPALISDNLILSHLYPIHACYAGMLYVDHIKSGDNQLNITNPINALNDELSRYGRYSLYAQKRNGDICFLNQRSKEVININLGNLIQSNHVLREFNAKQAFYLGILIRTANNYSQNTLRYLKDKL